MRVMIFNIIIDKVFIFIIKKLPKNKSNLFLADFYHTYTLNHGASDESNDFLYNW